MNAFVFGIVENGRPQRRRHVGCRVINLQTEKRVQNLRKIERNEDHVGSTAAI